MDTSTPEAETEIPQENAPGQQKRKGGRKPIYATSEERKQRNRQAQAAFRERRTEYIKQLEETIRVHETNLHNLQNAHRSAADECLMLRYKNSLLERILLEKGIDVQAELRAKTGSPHLGPTPIQQNMAQPPTVQRAIMNRHHQARRSNSSIAPKLEPGVAFHNNQSPQSRPTPPSHVSSPTTSSPGFNNNQGVLTPPSSDSQMQHQQQQRLQAAKTHAQHALSGTTGLLVNTGMGMPIGPKGQGNAGSNNTSSAPIDSVSTEQEYDAQADMVDDQPEAAGPGPYPEPLPQHGQHQQQGMNQQQQQPQQQQQLGHAQHPQSMQVGDDHPQAYSSMTQLLDPYDPMLDMDPFGLSASMQFPTQFSFDTSSMR
ncbi:BZIP transcription factor protein [Rutstroemia sp. NJR-2017a BVV2]|nr:BZIP transcription factor protein [Rutstroemia sp. NJR-2017a BVV2]